MKTTQEIYEAAVVIFRKACVANYNYINEDPSTSIEDVFNIVTRARKAYEWCEANGKGQDFKCFATTHSRRGIGDQLVAFDEVCSAVLYKEGVLAYNF